MTNDQKSMIAEMRRQGCSYAKIAKSLSISENTIKTFCRRNRLAKDSAVKTPSCKQCGCSIEVKDKSKPRQFCSDKCRAAWWHANHKSPSKTEYSLICANCGQPFFSIGSKTRKYCSHTCYINARFGEERGCNE
ncbi:MAG: helix-turn-helix domain-containing protein [Clostridiaceae bacterium]|nr:helix-turn-helix domain-containing protein [Clostridiaceae bacterium]